jgi:hypothetical protein
MVMINIIKIFLKNKVYQDFIYFKTRISQTSKTFFLRKRKIFYIKTYSFVNTLNSIL